ncbi:hypothetical protein E2C01_096431 [Portunus trituberculatus]|uniref:Uncharacterized protein n=1 Tax=Portunus trituberculatus TaxID=210409 RepID=A0A5B7K878_PORTR|nr:hypothetical protein [Portunus trituberculatus]
MPAPFRLLFHRPPLPTLHRQPSEPPDTKQTSVTWAAALEVRVSVNKVQEEGEYKITHGT